MLGGTSGLTAGTAFAIGTAAGAAGSIVSQGVGIATGVQEGFDWKGVALGAIGGGVTAGVGAYATNGVFDALGQYGSMAAIAATGSAITQGIGVVTGLQHSFSWKEVAISAVAAPVANYAGEQAAVRTGLAFAGQMTSGITGSLVRAAFGGKIDATSVLVDSFGNAVGNSIVGALHTSAAERRQREIQEAKARIREVMLPSTKRHKQWNEVVDLVKGELEARIDTKLEPLAAILERAAHKEVRGQIRWSLFNACIESEQLDVMPAGNFLPMKDWFVSGRFPCGWFGKYPQGMLAVY